MKKPNFESFYYEEDYNRQLKLYKAYKKKEKEIEKERLKAVEEKKAKILEENGGTLGSAYYFADICEPPKPIDPKKLDILVKKGQV